MNYAWSDELLRELANLLATRFVLKHEAVNVLRDAGIDPGRVAIHERALDTWHSALQVARPLAKVSAIVTAAAGRFQGEDRELADFLARRTAEEQVPVQPSLTPQGNLAPRTSDGTVVVTLPSVAVPLWRPQRIRDQLVFFAPLDGFTEDPHATRHFPLDQAMTQHVGRVKVSGGQHNHLVLAHRTVSASSAAIRWWKRHYWLTREPRCSARVMVGNSELEPGEEKQLYNGLRVMIGGVDGRFADGRFTRHEVLPGEIDAVTGLLGRDGLVFELAQALARSERWTLLIVQRASEPDEAAACRLALAAHDALPALPVARLGSCVVLLLSAGYEPARAFGELMEGAGVALVGGHAEVRGRPEAAVGCLEAGRAALARAMAGGHAQGLVDLAEHVVVLTELPRFLLEAEALRQGGGGVALLAVGDIERLSELDPRTLPTLEIELSQVIGHLAGSHVLLARAHDGVIACATPGPVDALLEKVALEWRQRGPVGNGIAEVERSLVVEEVAVDALEARAAELAEGVATRHETLPLPLAHHLRDTLVADSFERMTVFLQLVETSVRFVAIVLASAAAQQVQTAERLAALPRGASPGLWLQPWLKLAEASARALSPGVNPLTDILKEWFTDGGELAPWVHQLLNLSDRLRGELTRVPPDITRLQRERPAVDQALARLDAAAWALRGWCLVRIVGSERRDPLRDVVTHTYVDYTGSFERGMSREIAVQGSLNIGPFVYLIRFADGVFIPLEPYVRRESCSECGATELFWAEAPILAPGVYVYRSVTSEHPLELAVTARQLPLGLRGRG